MTRRVLVAVTLALLSASAVASCSDTQSGSDALNAEIAAIRADLGLTEEGVAVQGYGLESGQPSSDLCPGVDDRWTADKSFIVRPELVDADRVVAVLVDRYEGLGANVRRFHSTAGSDTQVLVFIDRERRIAIKATVERDGRTSVAMRSSSCPVDRFDVAPNGPYEEVAGRG